MGQRERRIYDARPKSAYELGEKLGKPAGKTQEDAKEQAKEIKGTQAQDDESGVTPAAENTDSQGNPLNEDGTLKLEKLSSIDEITDEDLSTPTRSVELPTLPKNVDEAIGANGKPVIIKKNIFEKNKSSHKDLTTDDSRKILSDVLYNPNLYGQNQKATRPFNWILVHLADKNEAVIVEVNDNKDNIEIVNWHYITDRTLEQKKRQAVKEGSLILTLESAAGNTLNGLSSGGKVTNKTASVQTKSKKTAHPLPFSARSVKVLQEEIGISFSSHIIREKQGEE